jgi:hypothetical protein
MKTITALFIALCFALIMLLPIDSYAGMHVKIDGQTVTVSLGVAFVVAGVYVLINYSDTAYSQKKYSFDKKRGVLIEEQYLYELQNRVTSDGKIILFRW